MYGTLVVILIYAPMEQLEGKKIHEADRHGDDVSEGVAQV